MRAKYWLCLLLLSFAVPSFGKEKKKTEKTLIKAAPAVKPKVFFASDEKYEAYIKQTKSQTRAVASARIDVPAIEKSYPADFLEMREQLIGNGKDKKGVVSVADLDRVVNKYSDPEKYQTLSNEARFLALQLRTLKTFKSFIFRARKYVDNISATRTLIVTMLRNQLAGIQTFFPVNGNANVNHWDVVFRYLTEASDDMDFEINSDDSLYLFLTYVTYDFAGIASDYSTLVEEKKAIWWDNKLYMSFANFASEKDRYVKLGEAEQLALHSAVMLNLSGLYATTAYSLTGLQASTKKVGNLFGIDGVRDFARALRTGQGADGMTSESRIDVLSEHNELFRLTSDGATRMGYAYEALRDSVRSANASFERAKNNGDSQSLFDAGVANGFGRVGDTSFRNLDNLFEKNEITSTILNGERIEVSLKKFYDSPPESLQELYPQAWKTEIPRARKVTAWGKEELQRSYDYGMATSWKLAPYRKLFPRIPASKANPEQTEDVGKYARVLSQTWGASAFAIPLSAFVF